MKIIIFHNSADKDSLIIAQAAQKRGHEVFLMLPEKCSFFFSSSTFNFFYDNQPFPECDAIVIRSMGENNANTFSLLLEQLEKKMNIKCFNSPQAVLITRHQMHTLQILSSHKISIPKTVFSPFKETSQQAIDCIDKKKIILKSMTGASGKGVLLTNSPHGTHSVVEALQNKNENVLLQECIEEFLGKSIRCMFIDNKLVATVLKESNNDNYLSHTCRGGKQRSYIPTKEEEGIALQATKVMGLDFAGIDIVQSKRGPKILEVNSAFGVLNMEEVTGIDVADLMIQHIEKKVGKKN